MSKKIVILGKKGYTVIATAEGVTEGKEVFVKGQETSTIGNSMYNLARVLNKASKESEIIEVAVIGNVADKVNSDILKREYFSGKLLNGRDLSDAEKQVYGTLISMIGASYANTVVKSIQFVPKSIKPESTEEQKEWVNIYNNANKMINSLTVTQPEAVMSFDEDDDLAL